MREGDLCQYTVSWRADLRKDYRYLHLPPEPEPQPTSKGRRSLQATMKKEAIARIMGNSNRNEKKTLKLIQKVRSSRLPPRPTRDKIIHPRTITL